MEMSEEKEALIELLLEPLSKSHILRLVTLVEKKPDLIAIVIQIIEADSYKEAMSAAWLLSHLWDSSPELLQVYQKELVNLVLATSFDSVRRSLLRVLDGFPIESEQMGPLFDRCLEWMLSEQYAIAVRCNAMQILYKICVAEPELSPELKQYVLALQEFGSAGFKSRGRKIIKQLTALEQKL